MNAAERGGGASRAMLCVERFVDDARACLCTPDPLHAVEALVREVVSDPAAVREAVAERAGSASALGFDVFCRSQALTIFHAALEPGFRNPAHDHGTWAVVGVYDGTERNVFYRRAGRMIAPERHVDATAPAVMVMHPGVIHAICNPLSTASRAIHVYGNDHFDASRSMWHPESLVEEPYRMERFREWSRQLRARR
ncbi:MAG TPA: hypothetical protein VL049_18045 [Candidatus Dormibacteraeota bacterium]|nr:hypothetical protein [Candidatus Dormibacteraeota bacterium]